MNREELAGLLPAMLPKLWGFSLRLCGNEQDAEDLVHGSCLRALERADQLAADTCPLSWLFAIVHTRWLNELRARRVRARSFSEWTEFSIESVEDMVSRTPEQNVMYMQMIDAMLLLPTQQCEVIVLIGIEGRSYKEAADILKVPIGTVMSRLSRARKAIGAQFSKMESLIEKL
jgi:RNA polymerase sigma-70 factor, ECF subfamily